MVIDYGPKVDIYKRKWRLNDRNAHMFLAPIAPFTLFTIPILAPLTLILIIIMPLILGPLIALLLGPDIAGPSRWLFKCDTNQM